MTLKECYDAMGADYNEVFARLRSDERIQRFLIKVLDDGSYDLLIKSLDEKNIEDAFRAAHTIKGVCMNLSLTKLYKSSQTLTEALRNRHDYGDDIPPLLEQVTADYEFTMNCIRGLL